MVEMVGDGGLDVGSEGASVRGWAYGWVLKGYGSGVFAFSFWVTACFCSRGHSWEGSAGSGGFSEDCNLRQLLEPGISISLLFFLCKQPGALKEATNLSIVRSRYHYRYFHCSFPVSYIMWSCWRWSRKQSLSASQIVVIKYIVWE